VVANAVHGHTELDIGERDRAVEGDGLFIVFGGILEVAHQKVHLSTMVKDVGALRLELNRMLEVFEGARRVRLFHVDRATFDQRVGVERIQRDRCVKVGQGVVELTLEVKERATPVESLCSTTTKRYLGQLKKFFIKKKNYWSKEGRLLLDGLVQGAQGLVVLGILDQVQAGNVQLVGLLCTLIGDLGWVEII